MGNGHIRYEYLGTGHYLSPWGGGGGVGGGSLDVLGEQKGGSVVT